MKIHINVFPRKKITASIAGRLERRNNDVDGLQGRRLPCFN
jgi:hypothetical protein